MYFVHLIDLVLKFIWALLLKIWPMPEGAKFINLNIK